MNKINQYYVIEQAVRRVLAIEMLEYEDKNLLRYDNKTNSEEKMRLLSSALDILLNSDKVLTSKNNPI